MITTPDLYTLQASTVGDIVTPGDERWDSARRAWNLVADQHPALIANAETEQDVQAVVRFATVNGLRVAPQSTGHGAATLGELTDTFLLRLSSMTRVSVDPSARTA
jgi:FAD/FMN-containing dehydrogenase